MKVLLINGSASEKPHTLGLLNHLATLLKNSSVDTKIWDLKTQQLPMVMPEYHRNTLETPNDIVRTFVQEVIDADAIILGTPLYHGSYSGLLKNALDSLHKDVFKKKPVGLVTNGSSKNSIALEHLQGVVRTMYGYSLQTQIATDPNDYEETKDEYVLKNDSIKQRSVRFTEELLFLTKALDDHKNK